MARTPDPLPDNPLPNPLPDSLRRLLDEPAARSFAPTPGDRNRGEPAPRHGDRARLDIVVLRGIVVAVTALVWVGILWLILRRLLS